MSTPARVEGEAAVGEVLVTSEELQRRVAELGEEISRDYAGRSLLLVGVGVETLSVVAWLGRGLGGEDDDGGGGGGGGSDDPDSGNRDGDGDGPPDVWRPADERAFWDYVARRRRPRASQ